ncbi:regulatory protein RecX [Kitasatospora sp. NPDC048540]|uniref:regulatory protein RecX n=1 Tax=Kitasatospora sp. NPDC048540 TaxID=3155634 RepID=UPI0033D8442F
MPELDLSELVSASQLPGGRRRRRSALQEESADGSPDGSAGVRATARGRARAGTSADADGPDADGSPAGRRGRSGRPGGGSGRRERDHHDERDEHEDRRERGRPAGAPDAESADPETRARDICLRLLTGAAKTRKQLGDALRRKEIPEEIAEQVLDRFEEVGLIDDGAFANAWVESRQDRRGRRALAQELRTKGVAGELVEQAVAQVEAEDETDSARALVDRKLRATRGLDRQARIRRLVAMLARRGYPEGLAFRVVLAALADEGGAGGAGRAGEDDDSGDDSGAW